MAELLSTTGLSPLDQIRLVEAEITRKVVTARDVSEHGAGDARARAAQIKKEARESGNREGEIHYRETVFKAEEEARTIVAHARNQAEDLRRKGQARMEAAIQEAVGIVLGLIGGGTNEP